MGWVSDFSTLLGAGERIEQLFGGSDGIDLAALEKILQNMFDNLLAEIKQVFSQDLTDTAAATAAGVAQTAHDFLAVDYVNAQRARVSQGQLWDLLTADTSGASLQALSAQASTMTTWASSNPLSMAQQTLALALTIYTLIVAIRRERAANSPDPNMRAAELTSMRAYAALAVNRLQPLLNSVRDARLGSISPSPLNPYQNPQHNGSMKIKDFGRDPQFSDRVYYYAVTDSWNRPAGSSQQVLVAWELAPRASGLWGPPSGALWPQISEAYNNYVKLAGGGADSDMAQWQQQLTQVITTGSKFADIPGSSWGLTSTRPGLSASGWLPPLVTLGSWLYQAQITLQSLEQLSLKGHACVFSETVVSVSQHPIDLRGMLRPGTLTPPLQFPSQNPPSAVVPSADGRYAYIVHQPIPPGISPICQYAIAADGTLLPAILSSLQAPGIATGLAVSPDGRSAYVTANSQDSPPSTNQVMQCSVAADGSLSLKTPPSVITAIGSGPGAIAISADGEHAYIANRFDNSVTHIPIAPDGTLLLPSTRVETGNYPIAIALSADGKSAYVANISDGTVWQYLIATDGTLSPQNPASLRTTGTGGQQAIALSGDGLSAYVVGRGINNVCQFSISAAGTLSPKSPATVTTGSMPTGIALSDDGLCAYVICSGDGTVWLYSIAPDGTLSAMTAPPATPGQDPATMVAIPAPTVQGAAIIALLPTVNS